MALEGAAFVAAAWDETSLETLASALIDFGGEAIAFRCDVSVRPQVDALVEKALEQVGRVDMLVNAAQRAAPDHELEAYPCEALDMAFDGDLRGTLAMMQAAFPHLRAARDASIINFGDTDAAVGEPGKVANNITKEAVRALT
jgi:NADP-dependent 3-hydroxy acid dehydrogenase YdfG